MRNSWCWKATWTFLWLGTRTSSGLLGPTRGQEEVQTADEAWKSTSMDFTAANLKYLEMHDSYEAQAAAMSTDAQGFQFDRTSDLNQVRPSGVKVRSSGFKAPEVDPISSPDDVAVAQAVQGEETTPIPLRTENLPSVVPAADGGLAIANGYFGKCVKLLPELPRRCNVPNVEDMDQVQELDAERLREGPGEECCEALTLFVDELQCFCYPAVTNAGDSLLQVVKNLKRFCHWQESQYEENPTCEQLLMEAEEGERKELNKVEAEVLSFGEFAVGSSASQLTVSLGPSPGDGTATIDTLIFYPRVKGSGLGTVKEDVLYPIVFFIPEYGEKPSAYQVTLKSITSQGYYVVAPDWMHGSSQGLFTSSMFYEAAYEIQDALEQIRQKSGIFGSGIFEDADTSGVGLVGHGKGALLATYVAGINEEVDVPIKTLVALSPVCQQEEVDDMKLSSLKNAKPVSVSDASCRAKLIGLGAACAPNPGSERCCSLFKDFNDNFCFCSEGALELGGPLLDLFQSQGGGYCNVDIVGKGSEQCNPQAIAYELEEQQNWSQVCTNVLNKTVEIEEVPSLVLFSTDSKIAGKDMAVRLNKNLGGQLVELTGGSHCFIELSSVYWPGNAECGVGKLAVMEQLNEARTLLNQFLDNNLPDTPRSQVTQDPNTTGEGETPGSSTEQESSSSGQPSSPGTTKTEEGPPGTKIPTIFRPPQTDGPAVLMLSCGGGENMELIITRGTPNSQVVILRGTTMDGGPGPLPDSISQCPGLETAITDAAQKRLGGMLRIAQTDHNGLSRTRWSQYRDPKRCSMFVYQALDLATCKLGPPLDTTKMIQFNKG